MGLPNIGPVELIIVLVIALLVLGPGKLPEVGSAFGKTIKEFRKASNDLTESASLTAPAPAPAPAPNLLASQPVAPTVVQGAEATAVAAAKDVSPRGTPADPVEDPT